MEHEDTYPMPKHGWTCFYCGDTFTTQGSASDHFGGDPGATAGCKIKAGDELGLLMELRKAEALVESWKLRALDAESQVEALQHHVNNLRVTIQSYNAFRECSSIQDVFNIYDSMEGRALAAEERLREK